MYALKPTLFSLLIWAVALPVHAGAGGTSGQDQASWYMILLLLPLLLGFGAYRAILRSFAKKAAGSVVRKAAIRDAAWNQDQLKKTAKRSFVELQNLWSNNDVEGSLAFLHPSYQSEYCAELKSIIAQNQRNQISQINVMSVEILLAKDYADDDRDMFVALIKGSMEDALYSADGRLLRTQGNKDDSARRTINEYWYFQRSGDDWLLSNISQSHDAVVDEVSLDEQSLASKHGEGIDYERAVEKAQTSKERSKSAQKLLASIVGISIAIGGYVLYFYFFRGVWRTITGFF